MGPGDTPHRIRRISTAAALALACAAAPHARAQEAAPPRDSTATTDSLAAGVRMEDIAVTARGDVSRFIPQRPLPAPGETLGGAGGADGARGMSAGRRFYASPTLPEDHWAVRAAARAHAMGLVPHYLPAQRAVPRQVVADALGEAAARAETERPELARIAGAWLRRFWEEFPEHYGRGSAPRVMFLGGLVGAGYADASGRLSPAQGYQLSRLAPAAVEDVSAARLQGAGGVAFGQVFSAYVDGTWDADDDFADPRWEVAVGAGAVQLSVGRQPVGYGYGRGGGVVLSAAEPLPRIELQTTRPARIPGALRAVGEWSVHTFVSRMDAERHPTEPYLWGMRVALRPHPRFTLAANRASIFGGEGRPSTLGNLARMAVGVIRNSDFENTIVSGEARWRLPTDAVLPATVYLEWGADDGAGAITEVPGRVAGVFLPALPGLPQVGVGGEYAHFGEGCCGHGPWYFSATFTGNWARGEHLLAHPLGGEGWEASGYAQAELIRSRLRLDGRFFVRERSDESLAAFGGGNLFSAARVGRSTGGIVEAALRLWRFGDLRAGYYRDAGDGWTEEAFHADVMVFF